MGVLNVTPDSFSDGGKFFSAERAVAHALAMEKAGADLLDIGGESTRPGSQELFWEEELARVLPVLEGLRGALKIPISIDTRKVTVAEAAIAAGAEIINDVSGLRKVSRPRNHVRLKRDRGSELARVAAEYRVGLILMHMRGEPKTMQRGPFARDVVGDVVRGLRESVSKALAVGVAKDRIVLDPGIGFGKSFEQNFELLRRLPELAKLGFPLAVGTSRKGFLGRALARGGQAGAAEERIWGTAATVAASILGGAHIVRVHDVEEMAQVSRVASCVLDPKLCGEN